MRRTLLINTLLLIAGALAWEFVPIQVTVWDGGFDLTVNVASTAGPVRSVSCQAYGRREHAADALEHLRLKTGGWSAVADPFDGRPLTVPHCSQRPGFSLGAGT